MITANDSFFASIISQAAAESDKLHVDHDGDYVQDGILHCGTCHRAKQIRIDLASISSLDGRVISCRCDCEMEAIRRADEARAERSRLDQIRRMRAEGIRDRRFDSWTFAADDGTCPEMKHAHNYVRDWGQFKRDGVGFMLWGEVGTGKTFMAACIANALLDRGVPVMMTSFPRLLNSLQGVDGRQAVLDQLDRYDLLIIDDLGVERQSQYAREQVYNVIDARVRTGLPLIVTTNLTMSYMQAPAAMDDQRIYDRILERCIPIRVAGESRRKAAANSLMAQYRDTYGL